MTDKVWYEVCKRNEHFGLDGPYGGAFDKEAAEVLGKHMFGENAVVREGNPDHMQGWGHNNKLSKPFGFTYCGSDPEHAQRVELVHGKHPHSRSDDNMYAVFPSGDIEGFAGHRLLHEIRLREYNYMKESYVSGDEVRKGGDGRIYINGYICGEFFFRDIMEALLEVRNLIQKIHNHPIQIWDKKEREKLVGRRVYWRTDPAVVTMFLEDQACVVLKPDGIEKFTECPWHEDGDEYEETIKDTIHSSNIWWWRD